MSRVLLSGLAAATIVAALSSRAEAFWERSQIMACAEAQSEAERIRRQCWIFAPVPEFPAPVLSGYRYVPYEKRSGRARGPWPNGEKVIRRLG